MSEDGYDQMRDDPTGDEQPHNRIRAHEGSGHE